MFNNKDNKAVSKSENSGTEKILIEYVEKKEKKNPIANLSRFYITSSGEKEKKKQTNGDNRNSTLRESEKSIIIQRKSTK